MAKNMKNKKDKNNTNNNTPQQNKLLQRFRIKLYSEKDDNEMWSGSSTRLGMIAIVAGIVMFIGFIMFSLFAWTPLHNILPGYLRAEARAQAIDNVLRVDSLSHEMSVRDIYMENIYRILTDDIPLDSIVLNDSIAASLDSVKRWTPEILSKSSPESEAFSRAYEESEEYNLTMLPPPSEGILFYPPLNGNIVKSYAPQNKMYGIEIQAARMSSASSVLDGTVVSITHTISNGYVMVIQHNNNYMSVYGNIGECMRQVGDNVLAGERIGRVGTTMNDVLHFELWANGTSIDPQRYIAF